MGKDQGSKTIEGYIMATAKTGTVFYSKMEGKDLASMAFHYGRKIKTATLLGVFSRSMESIRLVCVTILK